MRGHRRCAIVSLPLMLAPKDYGVSPVSQFCLNPSHKSAGTPLNKGFL